MSAIQDTWNNETIKMVDTYGFDGLHIGQYIYIYIHIYVYVYIYIYIYIYVYIYMYTII